MSWKISFSGSISMTRGDTPSFKVTPYIVSEDGTRVPYEPVDGDEIIFAVKRRKTDKTPLLVKHIPLDTMAVIFLEEDTKEWDYGTYIYEVSLNSGDYHCTFIDNKPLTITTEVY